MSKDVAKSLHTVTVMLQVSRALNASNPVAGLDAAMVALGLAGRPDPYALQSRALALLIKGDA